MSYVRRGGDVREIGDCPRVRVLWPLGRSPSVHVRMAPPLSEPLHLHILPLNIFLPGQ